MEVVLSYLVSAQKHRIEELEHLHRICELMEIISDLVHALQCERGASNIFLASNGLSFKDEWNGFTHKAATESGRLHHWLKMNEKSGVLAGGSRLLIRLALTVHLINDLSSIREKVRQLEMSPTESTGVYSATINALLALVFEVADIAVDPTVSKELVALFFLMQAKEFSGLERATGVRICSSGKSPELVDTLASLIESQENCFERFKAFSTQDVLNQWEILTSKMPNFEIEQMRRKLLSSKSLDHSIDAIEWFEICTLRINDIHIVEKYLTNNLAEKCQSLIQETNNHLNDHSALLASFSSEQPSPPISLLVSSMNPALQDRNDSLAKIGPALSMEILDVLQVQSKQLISMSEELLAVRATLDERKIIERAKGILMAHQVITEEKAYSVMRDMAMSQNQKMIEVAQSILSLSEFLKLKH